MVRDGGRRRDQPFPPFRRRGQQLLCRRARCGDRGGGDVAGENQDPRASAAKGEAAPAADVSPARDAG